MLNVPCMALTPWKRSWICLMSHFLLNRGTQGISRCQRGLKSCLPWMLLSWSSLPWQWKWIRKCLSTGGLWTECPGHALRIFFSLGNSYLLKWKDIRNTFETATLKKNKINTSPCREKASKNPNAFVRFVFVGKEKKNHQALLSVVNVRRTLLTNPLTPSDVWCPS